MSTRRNSWPTRATIAEFAAAKYARLFVGTAEKDSRAEKGVLRVDLAAAPDAPRRSRLLCVWGYSDYNKQGVADAYKRLEFRPFDAAWLEGMKPKWFDHWIGGGLEPEKKFLDARERFDAVAKQADDFWARQRRRAADQDARRAVRQRGQSRRGPGPGAVRVSRLHARPGVCQVRQDQPRLLRIRGRRACTRRWPIRCNLVAGTQDVTGRQRYNMTTFAISDWHEDMDFYFVDQCWYHWRWTGDERFLRAIWPAARRALEHGLVVSDPDGDGLMSGYYEMWNCDGNITGGNSALQTAMGWAALRAGRDMAAKLDDRDYRQAKRRHRATIRSTPVATRSFSSKPRSSISPNSGARTSGAWASAEVGGAPRPRPRTCEENYAIWRGLGTPMQNYMAMRYIRENYHHGDLIAGSTFEVVDDWWPIQWSLHWVASGDACASFHSACVAGDNDGHWPVIQDHRRIGLYDRGTKWILPAGTLWQGTGANSMEIEPLFLAAVVDGLFGVKPWFGENLLVLRPSPLAGWDDLELDHLDVQLPLPPRRAASGASK